MTCHCGNGVCVLVTQSEGREDVPPRQGVPFTTDCGVEEAQKIKMLPGENSFLYNTCAIEHKSEIALTESTSF